MIATEGARSGYRHPLVALHARGLVFTTVRPSLPCVPVFARGYAGAMAIRLPGEGWGARQVLAQKPPCQGCQSVGLRNRSTGFTPARRWGDVCLRVKKERLRGDHVIPTQMLGRPTGMPIGCLLIPSAMALQDRPGRLHQSRGLSWPSLSLGRWVCILTCKVDWSGKAASLDRGALQDLV